MTVEPRVRDAVSIKFDQAVAMSAPAPEATAGVTGASDDTVHSSTPTEVTDMDPKNTPVIDEAAIKAAATKAVSDLFAQRDSQAAVASHIVQINSECATAKATLVAKESELAKANEKLAATEAELAEAKKKLSKQDEDETAEDDRAKAEATKLREENDKLKAELAVATKTILEGAVAAKKKDREEKVDKAKVKGKFKERATATNEDGTLKMSDEDFDAQLSDLTANAATVENGTPAPATATTATTTPTEETKPAATAPAQPDLTGADAAAKATAALLVSGQPAGQSSGRTNYANMFGCD
jgi:hypothetical protein